MGIALDSIHLGVSVETNRDASSAYYNEYIEEGSEEKSHANNSNIGYCRMTQCFIELFPSKPNPF